MGKPTNNDGPQGSTIQCEGDICRAVLSFAAERINYVDEDGNTSYLHTLIFYVGNVINNDAQPDEVINYNIYFKNNARTYRLFKDEWLPLRYGFNSVDTLAQPYVLDNAYDEVCVRFDRNFPPNGALLAGSGKEEYCRPIVDATQGSAFNTGDPTVIADLRAQAATSSSNPSKFELNEE